MTSLSYFKIVLVVSFYIFFPASVLLASESSSTIEAGSATSRICHDAACSDYGSVNWRPTGATAVSVTDSGLSGYAWGDEIGWINLDPTDSGVSINTTTGALSGYAFANTGSWINFNPTDVSGGTDVGVVINGDGEFTGWAWVSGAYGGWMKFDCTSANTCVKTDWRPLGSRTTDEIDEEENTGSISSGGIPISNEEPAPVVTLPPFVIPNPGQYDDTETVPVGQIPTFIRDRITDFYKAVENDEPEIRTFPNHVESYNAPLDIAPDQGGLLVWNFSDSDTEAFPRAVTIEVPRYATDIGATFFVYTYDKETVPITSAAARFTIHDQVFEIVAFDSNGNQITSFNQPLRITLFVPDILPQDISVGVYQYSDGDIAWERILPVVQSQSSISFEVNHLSYFMIVSGEALPESLFVLQGLLYNPYVWFLVILIVLMLIYLLRKQNS